MSKLTELQRAEIVSWLEGLPWWDEVFAETDAGKILLHVAKAAARWLDACSISQETLCGCDVCELWKRVDEARKAGLL